MTDSHTLGQSVPKEGLFLLDGIEGLRSLPKHSVDMLLTDPPFGYVPLIGEAADQFVGSYSVRDRLLDFRINDVFMAWGENRGGFFEHNPILGLLKTSLFGEFRLNEMSGCSE